MYCLAFICALVDLSVELCLINVRLILKSRVDDGQESDSGETKNAENNDIIASSQFLLHL